MGLLAAPQLLLTCCLSLSDTYSTVSATQPRYWVLDWGGRDRDGALGLSSPHPLHPAPCQVSVPGLPCSMWGQGPGPLLLPSFLSDRACPGRLEVREEELHLQLPAEHWAFLAPLPLLGLGKAGVAAGDPAGLTIPAPWI